MQPGCCPANAKGDLLTRQFPEGTINITPREAAILQSYPADFEFKGGKGKIGLQIGNAVPPLLAEAVLVALWSPTVPVAADLELAA
jgi:site-specific DNA-cytosine methylase